MKRIIYILLVCLAVSVCLCSCVGLTLVDGEGGYNEKAELSVDYVYQLAKDAGYTGTLKQFIAEFKGEPGADGVGIYNAAFDERAHLILTLTNGSTIDCGKISINVNSSSSISIGENGNWYINNVDTGKRAEAIDGSGWHTGAGAPTADIGSDGDLYLELETCDIYQKKNGEWARVTTLATQPPIINEGDDYNVTINGGGVDYKYAASKALMSAVRIEALYASNFSGTYDRAANGSGVIYKLDKEKGDAYIITNHHVVYDKNATTPNKISDKINLYLYGMEYGQFAIPAEFVGATMSHDFAVLKVTGSELLKTSAVAAAEIFPSEQIEVLDTAIAVGNPASHGISVTLGSVSVKSEFLEMKAPDDIHDVEYRVIRIDTPLNGGNSGGGVFNADGKLIGIVSAKETSFVNMGYAIPSTLAVYLAENIIRNCDGKDNEQVIECVIGIMVKIDNITSEYDAETGTINITETCIVDSIDTGSIAEVMLMKGDVIKSFEIDGVTYVLEHNYQGSEFLLNATPESELFINIERDGEPLRIELFLEESNFSPII